jgi:membrane protein YdbS with pleckstrin-like domain
MSENSTTTGVVSSVRSTLAATLIATAVGVGVWFFGIARVIWPAHPQVAALLITVVASIVVKRLWSDDSDRRRI